MMPDALIGIFVGGRGRRMGGVAKGLLIAPNGEPIVERLIACARRAAPECPIVLVGTAESYRDVALPAVPDAPGGIGPMGGLRALLLEAQRRGLARALALSCDLPSVTPELIRRLLDEFPDALVLAPRSGELWNAMTGRYSLEALPALDSAVHAGEHALQRLFTRFGASAASLSLSEAELAALQDWDTPEDVANGLRRSGAT